MPFARPVLRAAEDAFADEPGLGQGTLLDHVLDVGGGLDPMRRRGLEEVLRQQALRLGAEAAAPRLGNQADPDVPGGGLGGGAVADGPPRDGADGLASGHGLDHQRSTLLADEAALANRIANMANRLTEVVELALVLDR